METEQAEETKKCGARRVTVRAKKAQLATAAAKAIAELAMVIQANAQLFTSFVAAHVILVIKQEALEQVQTTSIGASSTSSLTSYRFSYEYFFVSRISESLRNSKYNFG
jgi:hypothetical protein